MSFRFPRLLIAPTLIFCASLHAAIPRGGDFVLQRGSEPGSLNPITSDGHGAVDIQFYVIEPLLKLSEKTYAWEPALANAWRMSSDGRTYDFTLRPDARWSDGKPVTAEDVKFSFDVMFDDRYQTAHMRPYYQGLRSVEVLGPRRVRFHARDDYFGNFISSAGLPVVPKHVYAGGKNLSQTIVGSGPYVFAGWEKGLRITLKRNPDWWGRRDPAYRELHNPERVIFRFVGNETLALSMIASGKLDYMPLSADSYALKTAGLPKVRARNRYPKLTQSIALNLRKPLFRDVRVRRALAMLADRKNMIDKFRYGMALPARGPWYQQSPYADAKSGGPSFDPSAALALLREAGWDDHDGDGTLDREGERLAFTIVTSSRETERLLTMYQLDAAKVGVDVRIRLLDQTLLGPMIDKMEYDALDVSMGGGLVDFDPKPMWHSASIGNGGNNFSGFADPEVDALIEKARHTPAREARIPLMREVYRKLAAAVPSIFLVDEDSEFYAYSGRVGRPADTLAYEVGTKYWWVK